MSERPTLPDFDEVLQAIEAVRRAGTMTALTHLASTHLMALTACDSVSFNWMTANSMYVSVFPRRTSLQLSLEPVLAQHWRTNPLAQESLATSRAVPLAWSDVEGDSRWRDGPLFVDFYAPLGVTDQLVMQLPGPPAVMGVLAVNFSRPVAPGDRLVLATIGAHVGLQIHLLRQRGMTQFGFLESDPDAQLTREAWQLLSGPTGRPNEGPTNRAPGCAIRGLSPRECEVAILVADGHTNQQIASRFGIGVATVKKHCQRIYRALGVTNRAGAAVSIVRLLDADAQARGHQRGGDVHLLASPDSALLAGSRTRTTQV